jgi:hypothetical protein
VEVLTNTAMNFAWPLSRLIMPRRKLKGFRPIAFRSASAEASSMSSFGWPSEKSFKTPLEEVQKDLDNC